MSSFPLLALPPDTLQKLLNYYYTEELFQLSQCSRRAEDRVKTFALNLRENGFIINFATPFKSPYVVLVSNYFSNLGFTFYGERDPWRLNLRSPTTYNCDGQLIDFCKGDNDARYGCVTPNSTADVVKFINYLMTVFNAELCLLSIAANDDYLGALKNWIQKSRSVAPFINGGRVTHEEMTQVLETCEGLESLSLSCTPGPYFSYDKTISIGDFTVDNGTWIKRHNLLKFNCEFVSIRDCLLTNEDLNAFLIHWLQSGDKKLKTMRIYRERYCPEEKRKNAYRFVQEEVLKGLPTIPGAPKRPDVTRALRDMFLDTDVPFEAGMDLRRESDGVLATVLVRKEGSEGVIFTFVVWQEPNPNVF